MYYIFISPKNTIKWIHIAQHERIYRISYKQTKHTSMTMQGSDKCDVTSESLHWTYIFNYQLFINENKLPQFFHFQQETLTDYIY